jgi:DNA-binding NtrC family response regulator
MEVRATAEGALQLIGEQTVDLVLTDMMLPGMDGLDLVSRIQKIDPNLPVIMVTRMNAIPLAVDAMRRGAFDYVLKPVNAGFGDTAPSGDSYLGSAPPACDL